MQGERYAAAMDLSSAAAVNRFFTGRWR